MASRGKLEARREVVRARQDGAGNAGEQEADGGCGRQRADGAGKGKDAVLEEQDEKGAKDRLEKGVGERGGEGGRGEANERQDERRREREQREVLRREHQEQVRTLQLKLSGLPLASWCRVQGLAAQEHLICPSFCV